MASEIVMPQLGLTMTEGSVTTWLKQTGERVEKGEALFTVETDKVEMEVESTASGYLRSILVPAGQAVKVGTAIALITAGSDDPLPLPATALRSDSAPVAISPRARKLARELAVDIAQVTPANGYRIVEADVRQFHQQRPQAAPDRAPAARKVIAERLTRSFAQAPHFYLGMDVDATELVRLRSRLLEALTRQTGVRPTYTDFFLLAIARTLASHEAVNAHWQDGSVVKNNSVDVGFAVHGAESLLVPIVREANRLSLTEMIRQRSELAAKARSGKVTLRELEGGSATLSNLGPFGVDWFQAVLNPPQSVIVATGRIATRPVVRNGGIEPAETVTLTLSADHRVVDGVAAAAFLAGVKQLIENPYDFLF
jgi:pyruvate dehydrogenase E2 component (dihydrolipoamide acetyltransferase)